MSVSDPLSPDTLSYQSGGRASASLGQADEPVLSALLIDAMRRFAAETAGGQAARLVSVSIDMTGAIFAGGDIEIACRIDRQTRTLLFMRAELVSGGSLYLKATSIHRLG